MIFKNVPIIVLPCYVIGEFYKVVFKKKAILYKLIPFVLTIIGGILGIIIYIVDQDAMLTGKSIIEAIYIGMVSGASSTGANQIIKQIFKKGEENNEQIL